MKNARPILWGIIIVLAIIIFVMGAYLLSIVEARIGNKPAAQAATATPTRLAMSPTPILPSPTSLSPTSTSQAAPSATVIALAASSTSSTLPSPTPSPIPSYLVSATSVSCGAPKGWITYIVQPGDTLFRLSTAYGITINRLQQANCMGSSTLLKTGQVLFVPPWTPQPPLYVSPTVAATPTYPPLPTSLP
jgi:LysM repeat protein